MLDLYATFLTKYKSINRCNESQNYLELSGRGYGLLIQNENELFVEYQFQNHWLSMCKLCFSNQATCWARPQNQLSEKIFWRRLMRIYPCEDGFATRQGRAGMLMRRHACRLTRFCGDPVRERERGRYWVWSHDPLTPRPPETISLLFNRTKIKTNLPALRLVELLMVGIVTFMAP